MVDLSKIIDEFIPGWFLSGGEIKPICANSVQITVVN
jgi:hypothetical protein